ncbi:hypothetical protein [Acaryochloris sp. IP29b_bin.148]|uniref:hypothetical protein n=1 Tax=Acaryochloris sp. IP29b_bin.148 TaxID=2969218 RepID=UPI002619CBC8|nr:hypothetical protein [Acaryochloris sp. IP29b_bin.148]
MRASSEKTAILKESVYAQLRPESGLHERQRVKRLNYLAVVAYQAAQDIGRDSVFAN